LIGIGFLGALSFVLFVAALQAVVGLPGTALAAFALDLDRPFSVLPIDTWSSG
jgi:hypothetical protein